MIGTCEDLRVLQRPWRVLFHRGDRGHSQELRALATRKESHRRFCRQCRIAEQARELTHIWMLSLQCEQIPSLVRARFRLPTRDERFEGCSPI